MVLFDVSLVLERLRNAKGNCCGKNHIVYILTTFFDTASLTSSESDRNCIMLEIFSKVTVTEFRTSKVHTKTMKAHCDSYSEIGRRVKSAFPALQWT